MIFLSKCKVDEILFKPLIRLKKNHECAFCGEVIFKGGRAAKASFRYDFKSHYLYFHVSPGAGCLTLFNLDINNAL